jgi:hypothetical protein
MTISPEALEKARAIDWTRIDDALISCAGLLKTLCRDNIGDTAASELEYARSVIAALQAERDAAAPKLPDDLAGLVERLNGESPDKVTATDRLRLFAHDPDTFEFDQHDALSLIATIEHAAAAIQSLVARIAEIEAGLVETTEWLDDATPPYVWGSGSHIGWEAEQKRRVTAARSLLNKERQP